MTTNKAADSYPVIWTPIEKLVPYAKNAKKHSDAQVAKLAKIIQTYNFQGSIWVDKNYVIIAGHGRRLAAMKLGMKMVPVSVLVDLSPTEVDALRLAENRVSSTEYDQSLLSDEILRLGEVNDFDLTLTGYDEPELDKLRLDMTEMNFDGFVDDVSEAVERQQQTNAKKMDATDASMMVTGDAFGFKRVPVAVGRRVRLLIAHLETRYGVKAQDALARLCDEMGIAA